MAARPGSFSIHVAGMRKFIAGLRVADGRFPRDMTIAHKAIANTVAQETKRRAPVLRGDLRESYKARATMTSARVGSNLIYAPIIEFPNRYRPTGVQPHLYPALESKQGEIYAAYQVAVRNITKAAFPG
jgi:hypothetical protein